MIAVATGGFIFCLVQAVRHYAFLAPVALILQLGIGLFFAGPIFIVASYVVDYSLGNIVPDATALILFVPISVASATAILLVLSGKYHSYRRGIRSATISIIALQMLALIAGSLTMPGSSVEAVIKFIITAPLLFLVPYILAIYAAIYSNSLPDWISIALSRHILGQASVSENLRRFLVWLAVDALAVTLFVVATFAILVGVFLLCGQMITFASRLADAREFDNVSMFFWGSKNALPIFFQSVQRGSLDPALGQNAGAGGRCHNPGVDAPQCHVFDTDPAKCSDPFGSANRTRPGDHGGAALTDASWPAGRARDSFGRAESDLPLAVVGHIWNPRRLALRGRLLDCRSIELTPERLSDDRWTAVTPDYSLPAPFEHNVGPAITLRDPDEEPRRGWKNRPTAELRPAGFPASRR